MATAKRKRGEPRGLYSRNGVYYSRIAGADGRLIRKRLSADKATAKVILGQLRTTVEKQKFGILPADYKPKITSLAEVKRRYEAHMAGSHATNTLRTFNTAWSQVIQGSGARTVADLSAARVDGWVTARRNVGLRGQTINTYMILVAGALAWAYAEGLIAANPLAHWEAVRTHSPRPRRDLLPDEVKALFAAEDNAEWRTRWAVYLYTGLRSEAGSAIRWEWIDFAASTILLPLEANKSHRELAIPMHPALVEALLAWREARGSPQSGPLFRDVTRSSIWRRFKAVCARAGIHGDGLSTHSLRHTLATHVYEASDHNLMIVRDILGHKSIETTRRYLHLRDGAVAEALAKLAY